MIKKECTDLPKNKINNNCQKLFLLTFAPLFEYGNQKLGVSAKLIQKLKNIINVYDNVDSYSTKELNEMLLFLIENLPDFPDFQLKDEKNAISDTRNIKWELYYANIASNKHLGLPTYNVCNFSFKESYQFSTECLLRLNTELDFPKTVCPFEDFEEHLLATYHVLYYYFQKTGEIVFLQKMLISLYLINLRYIELFS